MGRHKKNRQHRLDRNPRRGRYWRAPRPDDPDPDDPHSRYAEDPPVPLAERDPALAEAILEPDDEEHTPEELAYQRAQIAAGFGDPYAQD